MTNLSTKFKLSTPALTNRGMTLVEVLIGAALGGLIIALAMGISVSNRKLLTTDQARTTINQNLRSALDIVGNDIRITGERLSRESNVGISAIEVVGGNKLILRRNLSSFSLPFCEGSFVAGHRNIVVALNSSYFGIDLNSDDGQQCRVIDTDGDGKPDNWQAWKEFREENGGRIRAYLYTPSEEGVQDFFNYVGETEISYWWGGKKFQIDVDRSEEVTNTYRLSEKPNLLLLEEQTYYLDNGTLMVNKDNAITQSIINDIESFEVRVVKQDGSKLETFNTDSGLDWTEIAGIEISITGKQKDRGKDIERTLTGRYFPRNILSN